MTKQNWRPTASLETLRLRARMLSRVRSFFAERAIMEVETPALSRAASTDPNIASFVLPAVSDVRYLHTSPEFPMKRLLAAGSGDIYQICKVFRADEAGRCHNPEFTLLEWYRLNLDHFDLMNEVEALLGHLLEDVATVGAVQRLSYRDAFHEYAGFDALTSNATACAAHAARLGIENNGDLELRQWLELIFSETIVPACARHGFTFIYDFPADQAALARVRPGDPPLAERFELIGCGLELANGFHELADVDEQRERFERELSIRQRGDAPDMPIDEHLLAALARGANPSTLRITERFTPVGPDAIAWTATIEDAMTWSRPWTIGLPLRRDRHPSLPFECHEGNYGLKNMLSAARAAERSN